MKCWTLLVNRNRAKLLKKSTYEANLGTAKVKMGKSVNYRIPDDSIPFEVEKSFGSIPLWIVNEKTLCALTVRAKDVKEGFKLQESEIKEWIEVTEKTDTDAHTKLNLLIKREFWKQVAMKIKLSLVETLIYLAAGYGFLRFLEYIIITIFAS